MQRGGVGGVGAAGRRLGLGGIGRGNRSCVREEVREVVIFFAANGELGEGRYRRRLGPWGRGYMKTWTSWERWRLIDWVFVSEWFMLRHRDISCSLGFGGE